jgi:hypothetical protein
MLLIGVMTLHILLDFQNTSTVAKPWQSQNLPDELHLKRTSNWQ